MTFFCPRSVDKVARKVLPSAKTFDEVLLQDRADEQQEKQLSSLHYRELNPKVNLSAKAVSIASQPKLSHAAPKMIHFEEPSRRVRVPSFHHECYSQHDNWRDCPQHKPPNETPGRNGSNQWATNAVSTTHVHYTKSHVLFPTVFITRFETLPILYLWQ